MHQNSHTSMRKKAFRRACKRVFRTQTSQGYRHGTFTPDYLRGSGLEPPLLPAHSAGHPSMTTSSPTPPPERRPRRGGGAQGKPLRLLSWNSGHLGLQQWLKLRRGFTRRHRKLVISSLCRKHIGMKQPSFLLRGGSASALPRKGRHELLKPGTEAKGKGFPG